MLFVSALHKLAEPEIEHLYTTFEIPRHNIVALSDSGMHELAPSFEHTINLLKQPELPLTLPASLTNPCLERHTRRWAHFSELGSTEHLASLMSETSHTPDLVGMMAVYQFLVKTFPDIMRAYSYEDVRKWEIPSVHDPGHSCRKHFSSQHVMQFMVMRNAQ